MATNLALDDQLITEALVLGKQKTKKAVVTEALEEYVNRRKQLNMINLFNSIDYDESFDYKEQRKIK